MIGGVVELIGAFSKAGTSLKCAESFGESKQMIASGRNLAADLHGQMGPVANRGGSGECGSSSGPNAFSATVAAAGKLCSAGTRLIAARDGESGARSGAPAMAAVIIVRPVTGCKTNRGKQDTGTGGAGSA